MLIRSCFHKKTQMTKQTSENMKIILKIDEICHAIDSSPIEIRLILPVN